VSELAVLRPGRIGDLEIPNRIVRTAHTTLLGERAQIGERFIAYHERAARGGAGLHILEVATVHRSSPGPLNIADDRIVSGLARLMDRLRPHGVRVFQQVGHAGPQAPPNRDGDPPWAASQVQPVAGARIPIAMTKAMIDDVVEAFAAAAERAERSGVEGIEIHGAHGYLIHSFLSPLQNQRDDEYGGDAAGRTRFLQEVMAAVRISVSPRYPVGVRVSPDGVPGGLDSEMLAGAVAMLEANGVADFVDVSLGSYFNRAGTMGGMYAEPGYQLRTSLPITRATGLPGIVTGRFTTLEKASEVVAAGDAQFVGMTRAHIADPDAFEKFRTGHGDEVRPCIACDACAASIETGTIGCAVNPTAGHETTLEPWTSHTEPVPRRVVVIGGGPAGLEAARSASIRGHDVVLLEREPEFGGQLRLARRAPYRARIGAIVDWLEREVTRLGVDVRRSTEASVASVLALAPDTVIVATGSRPRLDGVQTGCEPMRVVEPARLVSSWEVLGSDEPFAGSAVVIDDTGLYEPAAAAERLMEDGVAVTYVTRLSAFLAPMAAQFEPAPALRRFRRHDFQLHTRCRAAEVRRGEVDLRHIDGGEPFTAPADLVVFVSANRSETALPDALGDLGAEVAVVGDALSPRGLRTAIGEGFRAGATPRTGRNTNGARVTGVGTAR
jgi:2,4-dienoyl-CoA reductase-like NADH-dependent reductase (Old Yellow Enzyme family)/thioredoxin reductase